MANGRLIFEASLVGILGIAVFGSTLALVKGRNDLSFLDPLIEVKSALSRTYVDDLSPEMLRKMQEGAITGMIEALEDPYTVYVPPADTAQFEKDLTGEYVGIGAQVQVFDNFLTIVTPLEDSPAFRAGVMPEDKVIEIEGETTRGLTVEQCVDKLVGKSGTKVTITIERKGEKLPPLTLVREQIKTKSVKGFHRVDGEAGKWQYVIDPARSIVYIRMEQFTPKLTVELIDALKTVGNMKGLILDVRGNPGGLLDEAVNIADLFLKEGVIVSTRGRAFKEVVVKAQAAGTLPDFPIAILINGQSASASEILAGALVENNRAIAVGTRTFGKGSVQTVKGIPVADAEGNIKKGELKMTEQGYYLPSGRSLSRKSNAKDWGVDATKGFTVQMSDEETLALLKVRRDESILHMSGKADADAKWNDPEWSLARLKDPQLAAAVHAMQAKIDTGEWKPTGTDGPQIAQVVADELAKLQTARDRMTRDLIRIDHRAAELEKGLSIEEVVKGKDLWPDTTDVAGGKVQVFDKDGKLVATLDITGNSLERWLVDADVKKHEDKDPK